MQDCFWSSLNSFLKTDHSEDRWEGHALAITQFSISPVQNKEIIEIRRLILLDCLHYWRSMIRKEDVVCNVRGSIFLMLMKKN